MATTTLDQLVNDYRAMGAIPYGLVERALPEDATVEDMEDAFAVLASHGIEVRDDPEGEEPVDTPATPDDAARLSDFTMRFLGSSFELPRILGAAGASARSHVFRAGTRAEDVAPHVAVLRQASEEARGLREVLRAKKLSEVKRKSLRASLDSATDRIQKAFLALPVSEEWLVREMATLRRAAERVECARKDMEARVAPFGIALKVLRRMLRESREDERRRDDLAGHLHISSEEVEALDRDLRTAARVVLGEQDQTRMPEEEILRLLPGLRAWEEARQRRVAARLMRTGSRRAGLAFDLEALNERLASLAERAEIRTDLPVVSQRQSAPLTRARRIAYAAEGEVAQPAERHDGATYADLGRFGEAVIFAVMRARWESAARTSPDATRVLLARIVETYWLLDPGVKAALDAVLGEPPETWLSSELVQDILWPARTAFGDAIGFDLFGLAEASDDWLCVEVKTTVGPAATQFELTVNEYERARAEGKRYAIARVSRALDGVPSIHLWNDPVVLVERGDLNLVPSAFTVSLRRIAKG